MQLPAPSPCEQSQHTLPMKVKKMFTALLKKFTAEPQDNPEFIQANEALKERVAHLFWKPGIEPNTPVLEMKRKTLVKNPVSIRKAIAA
jgi:hypothetical protein